jgi:hypothetical protein
MTIFGRKSSLTIIKSGQEGQNVLDLSDFHFTFNTVQADLESPNNARIRVFNLSPREIVGIIGEFDRLVLQAGYEGQFGVIFDGTIRQIGVGKVNTTDSFIDFLVAEGDQAYNYAVVNTTLEAEATGKRSQVDEIQKSFTEQGVNPGYFDQNGLLGGTFQNPRGKVLFGMSRKFMREAANSIGATWSIQKGKLNLLPLTGFLPNEAVVLSSATGLLGTPEQQLDGVKARALIDPRFIPGQLVKIDNTGVNEVIAGNSRAGLLGNFNYNQRVGLPQFRATVAVDGLYRIFVCEYTGDTRGEAWYADLTLLSIK